MNFHIPHRITSIIIGLGLNLALIQVTHAQYQRCWIENGIITINCDPADGYSFKKNKTLYKKCPIASGKIQKPCYPKEDGYGLFYQDYHWYQCPIQQGKKLDDCILANGYHVIEFPNQTEGDK